MADRVASQPFPRCSAARHCEIRPPVCENLLSSDFLNGRYAHEFLHVLPSRLTTLLSQPYTKSPIRNVIFPIGRHSHVVPPILHQTLLTLNMLTIVTVDTYYFQHPSLQGELQKLSGVFAPNILSLNLHHFLLFLVNVKYKLFSWYQISPQNSIAP